MDEQTNPVIQPEVQQPEIQPDKPTSKAWRIVALIVAGILVIGGLSYGAYYWWQNYGGRQQACTKELKICPDGSSVGRTGPNCEFAACPVDETADWQTYQNEELGFEFKYPKDYELKDDKGVERFPEELISGKSRDIYVAKDDGVVIRFLFLSDDYKSGVQEGCCYHLEKSFEINDSLDQSLEGLKVLQPFNLRRVINESHEGLQFFSIEEYSSLNVDDKLYFPYSKNGYTYLLISSNNILSTGQILSGAGQREEAKARLIQEANQGNIDESRKEQYTMFKKILSTFKFIDPTADWQTYQGRQFNVRFPFEIRYPKNWKMIENLSGVVVDEVYGNGIYLEEKGVRTAAFTAGFLANSDWSNNIAELNKGFDDFWNFWLDHLKQAEENPNAPWPAFLYGYVSKGWSILSRKEINFLGKQSLQIEFQDDKKIAKSIMILTPYPDLEGLVYRIEMFNYFDKIEIKEALNQILSTFKFIK